MHAWQKLQCKDKVKICMSRFTNLQINPHYEGLSQLGFKGNTLFSLLEIKNKIKCKNI